MGMAAWCAHHNVLGQAPLHTMTVKHLVQRQCLPVMQCCIASGCMPPSEAVASIHQSVQMLFSMTDNHQCVNNIACCAALLQWTYTQQPYQYAHNGVMYAIYISKAQTITGTVHGC